MISKVIITDKKKLPISYWTEVKPLVRRKEFVFKPGLNVICGPNGCGKSTLLKLIRLTFHCYKTYRTVVTQSSASDVSTINKERFTGYDIIHSGSGVAAFDSTQEIGMEGGTITGGIADMVTQYYANTESAGNAIKLRYQTFGKAMGDDPQYDLRTRVKEGSVNDFWVEGVKAATYIMNNTDKNIKDVGSTCILDEPERNMDFKSQKHLWDDLKNPENKMQLIVATHSPFAFNIEHANYINLYRNYNKDVTKILKEHFK